MRLFSREAWAKWWRDVRCQFGHHPGDLVRRIGPVDQGWVFCANCYTYMRKKKETD